MIIRIFTHLMESIGFTYCLTYYLQRNERYKKEYTYYLFLSTFIIFLLRSFIQGFGLGALMIVHYLSFVYSCLFFSNRVLEILYILLFSQSMILYADILSITTTCLILHIPLAQLIEEPSLYKFVGLFSSIVYVLIVIGLSKTNKIHLSVSNNSILYLFIVYIINFFITHHFFIEVIEGRITSAYSQIIVLLASSLFIFLYYMYNKLKEENEKYFESILLNEEVEKMKEYLNTFSIICEENRKIRHDLKNALLALNQGKDCEKIIDEIQSYSYILPNFLSTNVTFTNIVNSKILHYQDQKIDWRFFIESDLERIKKIDLAIILGNLLDNACENLGSSKIIEIHTKTLNNIYNITIKNSIDDSVLNKNPLLHTKKGDIKNHGYGVKSVEKIVQSYHGQITFFERNHEFNVDLFLQIPQESNK